MIFDLLGLLIGFVILISTRNIFIIVAVLFISGLFMAPVFPLGYAISKESLQGSAFAMNIFTALTSLGGIVTPYMIGAISNTFNIQIAILILSVNASLIFIFSILNYKLK